jgi:hypothetical protein
VELEGGCTRRTATRNSILPQQFAVGAPKSCARDDRRSSLCCLAAGLIGAISQRLRASRPVWATAAVVSLALPALTLTAQLGVHRIAHTPHLGAGGLATFCFASASSAFSWYAMRHGALLGETDTTSLVHDIRNLLGITVSFAVAIPRALFRYFRGK